MTEPTSEPKPGHYWRRNFITGAWEEVECGPGGRQLLASVKTAMDCDTRRLTKSISNRKPMVAQSLAVHGTKLAEHVKKAPRGTSYVPTDNGFYAPVTTSAAGYKRLLKSRQKINKDDYC